MSDSEGGIPLIEPLSPSPQPSSKRKRDDDGQKKKSHKRKRTKKPKDIDDADLDEEAGINRAVGHMDPRLLADHVAQRTKRFESELSFVELEDRYLPEKAIRDTSSWTKQRDLENLPAFLTEFAKKKIKEAPGQNGSPHTLVVAGAGLRAADLTRYITYTSKLFYPILTCIRALRTFQGPNCAVAKLFAKHIKLKEAITTCQKLRMGIGVGTPQRISDLLDNNALSLTNIRRIVVDASHIDMKKRGILDMKEIQVPLVSLLVRKEIKERYGKGADGIELLFY